MSRCPTRRIRERASGFHEAGHAIVVFFLAAVFCGLLTSLGTVSAEITERGLGILYGSDHAFALRAPNGWMLDNESGVEQGLYAVFYPKGTNWRDSVVVAYARARERTQEIASAADAVRDTIDDFHASGSPNYHGRRIKTVKIDGGKEAVIYHFAGDQWGNSEAVAYYVEKKTINFIVLTSRDPQAFDRALPAFKALVRSYVFMGDDPLRQGK